MRLEDLGLVGNCQFSALIENTGSVVWCCLPRFDSEPIFARLLDEKDGGEFLIGAEDGSAGGQNYLENTNILETLFVTPSGSFRVYDFAPRFIQYDRTFRPTQLVRIVEPIDGAPRIRVNCDPRKGWSKAVPERLHGSNHVGFQGYPAKLRLTTDIPVSYLSGQPFALAERRYMALTWGAPIEEPLAPLCERFFHETARYWRRWVKESNVPPMFQDEVIRSALALKLHTFEDTGAIIAAMTTSIPESPGSGRTWDYRYCWLRDAYYALSAFHLLGHFEERERFVRFLINIASASEDLDLAPLYAVDAGPVPLERILHDWPGFNNEKPVRVGNAAALQRQNDVFGEMVLALCPVFLDDRFREERTGVTLNLLERLTKKALATAGTNDAGIWEFRKPLAAPQTFTSLMSFAAADRMAMVAARHRPKTADWYRSEAERIKNEVIIRAWNQADMAFSSSYGGTHLDASLLQMASLRMLPGSDPRLSSTLDALKANLGLGDWLMRYRMDDGFGTPATAFVICTYWLVEALVTVRRITEARELLEKTRTALSPLGLISEDYDVSTGRLWGNFPQAYSHVGLIHAAFAASPRWSEVL